MKKWIYYVNELEFNIKEGENYISYFARVKINACTYLYASDTDGNRGVYVTDRDSEIEEVRDINENHIKITDEMEAKVQRIISEKGLLLE